MVEIGIIPDTPCREWQGAVLNSGYGQIRRGKSRFVLHRYVWELANGPIPAGMFVCHRCDNKRCYRLDHLFLGTAKDNIQDMWAKGRGPARCVRRALLTPSEHERLPWTPYHYSLADQRRDESITAFVLIFGHAARLEERRRALREMEKRPAALALLVHIFRLGMAGAFDQEAAA
jgi:hypothetical protein